MKNIKNRYNDFFDDEDSIKEKRQKYKVTQSEDGFDELSSKKKQINSNRMREHKKRRRK